VVGRLPCIGSKPSFCTSASGAASPEKTWGGRRRALLSPQEEDSFLKPWAEEDIVEVVGCIECRAQLV
jgi:hypothetical protein